MISKYYQKLEIHSSRSCYQYDSYTSGFIYSPFFVSVYYAAGATCIVGNKKYCRMSNRTLLRVKNKSCKHLNNTKTHHVTAFVAFVLSNWNGWTITFIVQVKSKPCLPKLLQGHACCNEKGLYCESLQLQHDKLDEWQFNDKDNGIHTNFVMSKLKAKKLILTWFNLNGEYEYGKRVPCCSCLAPDKVELVWGVSLSSRIHREKTQHVADWQQAAWWTFSELNLKVSTSFSALCFQMSNNLKQI